MIRKFAFFVTAFAVACTLPVAAAQTVHHYDKYLSRIDLGIEGVGEFNGTVSGTIIPPNAPNADQPLSDTASNTLGALVTLRYVVKPYLGLEGNVGYSRYTQNFSYTGGIQNDADEFSFGYVVTPKLPLFSYQPFASVGTGTMEFKPTPGGGQSLSTQARQLYYYSIGLQKTYLFDHIGLRAGFRQDYFYAPDFGQNYLTIKQHTFTSEPMFGFYVKF